MNQDSLTKLKNQRFLPGPALRNSVVIEGTLTTRTDLHIGSGEIRKSTDNDLPLKRLLVEPDSAADPVDRDPRAPCRPYIPGSSLRGVVRAWCEAMLAPFGAEVATLGARPSARAEVDVPIPEQQGIDAVYSADHREALKVRDDLDLVSGLFGSTRWRSKVEIRAARLPAMSTITPGVLNRVAIDHHLGSAEHGKLFSVEYVPRGTAFETTIVARNVTAWELGLLLHALDSFGHKHFPTRIGALGGHDWGRVAWKATAISRLGKLDGSTSPLLDWISASGKGKEALPIPEPEITRLKANTTEALRAAVLSLGEA